MYSIYEQINNRRVLVYPERTTVDAKKTDSVVLTNEQITSTYFPEDIDVKPEIYFDKVEIGEGNYIFHGDNIQVLKTLPDNSVDSVVTDPPYGLKFMGKQWDYDVPSVELWKECYRVLKPGGYLLSFGSSRTYHRMAVKVEDAGFEIRDQIMWVYGSGFPKSHNIGKAVDKDNGKSKNLKKWAKYFDSICKIKDISNEEIDSYLGLNSNGATAAHFRRYNSNTSRFPKLDFYYRLKTWLKFDDTFDNIIKEAEREIIGIKKNQMSGWSINNETKFIDRNITIAKTSEAKKYEGWGTALKPAHEPIVMARKPFKGSVAKNVLKWNTGGINIDDCRVDSEKRTIPIFSKDEKDDTTLFGLHSTIQHYREETELGRFPANIIFDEEAGILLDEQSGQSKSSPTKGHIRKGNVTGDNRTQVSAGLYGDGNWIEGSNFSDKGGASRFFYCPKPSKKEKEEGLDNHEHKMLSRVNKGGLENDPRWERKLRKNTHSTVKPLKLIQYLIRLVTPIGGITIDPFFGSGTSGKSALKEDNDYKFIGIEKEKEYFNIAVERCQFEHKQSLKVAA
jgi:DNA modification methylase